MEGDFDKCVKLHPGVPHHWYTLIAVNTLLNALPGLGNMRADQSP